MAKQVQKSGLAGRLGPEGRKAVAAHKDDQVDLGFGGDLPPGIENGVAQLTRCWFDQYKEGKNKGEYYFMAMGTVVEPKEYTNALTKEVVNTEGRITKIGPMAMCATERRSLDENVGRVLNEMRKLGVDTSTLSLEDLESTAEALQGEAPFFKFRTWIGKPSEQFPNPTTNHDWKGQFEYNGEAVDDVQDNTATVPDDDATAAADEPEEDLVALGEAADGGDEDAVARLTELCDANNIDPAEIETWGEVATLLTGGGGDESQEDISPEKGQVYYYKPPKAQKAVECEVTYAGKRTVNLKNLDDGKTIYKVVSFDSLLRAPE